MDQVIFSNHPSVSIGSNLFIDVRVPLQYEEQPLIEVCKNLQAGYLIQIPIFNSDGTYLAKVVGGRIHRTPDGEKVGISMREENNLTACELNGKTIFELRRVGPAALKTSAELYTHDGFFIKSNDVGCEILKSGDFSKIGNINMFHCTFQNLNIGILWARKETLKKIKGGSAVLCVIP